MNNKHFIEFLLKKNDIKTGFNIDELSNHLDFLKEKSQLLKRNKRLADYEPTFTSHQKY
ncbi:hypothetical protein GCM10009865_30000 [Aeromicrobium ponti]|uniref:Uncharacterized protein n=1 Tax=Cytobacillus oceanisediminis TaxID=665099 RepID=A0A562JRG0_9BACI|nr:hypothetical protein [Cytobacillus oceanisediminis]TWH85780.1 hypothetical protein IQ19_02721 [Cytobacillus oceanisediminis]